MSNLKSNSFTPEYVQSKLFYFHDAAHKFHLDTRSYAEHKALDILYNDMVGFKDTICELMIGYMNGKRIGKLKLEEVPEYNSSESIKLTNNVKDFSYELEKWAEQNKYCDIENTAQSLSGLASKVSYLLTLT